MFRFHRHNVDRKKRTNILFITIPLTTDIPTWGKFSTKQRLTIEDQWAGKEKMEARNAALLLEKKSIR